MSSISKDMEKIFNEKELQEVLERKIQENDNNILTPEQIEDLALISAKNFGVAEKIIFWDEDDQMVAEDELKEFRVNNE